ncbi:hypothetical protein ACET3Z_011803 [Daucus carota]
MDDLFPRAANSSPLTPLGFLDRAAVVYGDCLSLVYGDTTYTWLETRDRCLKLASSISRLGLGRGDVVSVIAPNIPAMYELHFAIPMAGAILNTINTRLDARTISVILRHSESKLVFVDYESSSVVSDAVSMFPTSTKAPLLVFIADLGSEDSPALSAIDFHFSYEKMVQNGDVDFKWIRPKSEWDPLTLNYTSGTTSAPKGVVHSHRGTFIVTLDSLVGWSVPKQPVYLWTLPMFHANGWSYTWGMTSVGGTNICLRKFDARTIYSAINRHGVTHMCGSPVVLNMLSSYPEAKALNSPVQLLTGGAPPPAAVLLKAESMGVEVESILYTHPLINESAVVARPDEYWGETPCAFVSLHEDSKRRELKDKDIIEFCRSKLAHYMVPKTVVFMEELPKTSTGKIQKFVLRERAKKMGSTNTRSRM